MKKLLAMAVAASTLAIAAPASAQVWQSIDTRQANLDARIDAGVRSGDLTRAEALRLRAEFRDIARLEAHYRASYGLSLAERRDLDRRFDALSARIRYERNDEQDRYGRYGRDDDRYGRGDDRYGRGDDNYGRGWVSINARQRVIENRIYSGMRSGRLSEREAGRIRAEFGDIVRLEARYRRNGLNRWERVDLERRFDHLDRLITAEARDHNNYRG
jgi:hypothetical protein